MKPLSCLAVLLLLSSAACGGGGGAGGDPVLPGSPVRLQTLSSALSTSLSILEANCVTSLPVCSLIQPTSLSV